MNNLTPTQPRATLGATVALLVGLAVASAAPAWSAPSHVLPAGASPHGISLTAMAGKMAAFNLSGNDPATYPDTPFQVLYANGLDLQVVDGGLVATGGNSFTVSPGTPMYVPIFGLTDIPPFLAPYPTSASEAATYFFDPALHGAAFELVVDGVATPIGPEHVTGPVSSGGDRIVNLAAFVGPLSVGTHTVTISGGLYGPAVQDTYGLTYVEEQITYTIVVQPGA